MHTNKVTIGIPTLNRSRYLKLAIGSALQQTYTNIEVIVSNNASSDDTTKILSELSDPRVKVLHQTTTLSMVDNWNACLKAASGTYFLLLSDDDVLEPRAIMEMVTAYERASDPDTVGFVYCRGRFIDENGNIKSVGQAAPPVESAADLILSFFQSKRDTWPCSILLRTSDISEGYSSHFALITDAAMWMRSVVRRGTALFVDEELVNYRVHQNTTASTPISTWQGENTALAKYAIESLKDLHGSCPSLFQRIEKAVDELNTRIIPALILSSSGGSWPRALRQYLRYLPRFTTPYGLTILSKGFLVLFLPSSIVAEIKSLRNRFNGRERL